MNATQLLSKHQLKITEARQKIIEMLQQEDAPVDAQFLIDKMQIYEIDRVTVFRILKILAEKGILRKLDFGEGKARYEIHTGEHHHLICTGCGKIQAIERCNIDELKTEILNQKKFTVTSHSTEFFGLCQECQEG